MSATMTAAPAGNGKARRSLNETIEKLDGMIDGLSEAIPETIADCLREGVAEAVTKGVQAAVVAVLSDPAVMARVRPAGARPTLRDRVRTAMATARRTVARWVRTLVGKFAGGAVALAAAVYAQRTKLGLLWRLRRPLLVAVGVGTVAAVVTVAAPGWLGACVSAVGGTCTTLAVQGWLLVRRAFETPVTAAWAGR